MSPASAIKGNASRKEILGWWSSYNPTMITSPWPLLTKLWGFLKGPFNPVEYQHLHQTCLTAPSHSYTSTVSSASVPSLALSSFGAYLREKGTRVRFDLDIWRCVEVVERAGHVPVPRWEVDNWGEVWEQCSLSLPMHWDGAHRETCIPLPIYLKTEQLSGLHRKTPKDLDQFLLDKKDSCLRHVRR